MSKIAIFSDPHFGSNKSSEIVLESQKRFLFNQFFPYLREHEITQIFCLGDIFDNRVAVNTKIWNEVYDIFNNEFEYHVLVGNHDSYGNSNLKINSLKFLRKFSNVMVYEKIQEIQMFDKKILMVPWIFDNDKFLEDLKNYNSDIVCGHFDVNGFSMSGKLSNAPLTIEHFSKFKKVFSGHFHSAQSKKYNDTEFIYCGSIIQNNWGDCDQKRGFYILDTSDLSYEFIENTQSAKHIKVEFGTDITSYDLKNNFVKIFVKESQTSDESKLEEYTQKISDSGIANLNTVIIKENLELDNDIEIDERGQSLLELIKEYLQIQEQVSNKSEISEIIEEIYEESLKE
jgi:DNA repair exonuclease SbcCD nuclease subunit